MSIVGHGTVSKVAVLVDGNWVAVAIEKDGFLRSGLEVFPGPSPWSAVPFRIGRVSKSAGREVCCRTNQRSVGICHIGVGGVGRWISDSGTIVIIQFHVGVGRSRVEIGFGEGRNGG